MTIDLRVQKTMIGGNYKIIIYNLVRRYSVVPYYDMIKGEIHF